MRNKAAISFASFLLHFPKHLTLELSLEVTLFSTKIHTVHTSEKKMTKDDKKNDNQSEY